MKLKKRNIRMTINKERRSCYCLLLEWDRTLEGGWSEMASEMASARHSHFSCCSLTTHCHPRQKSNRFSFIFLIPVVIFPVTYGINRGVFRGQWFFLFLFFSVFRILWNKKKVSDISVRFDKVIIIFKRTRVFFLVFYFHLEDVIFRVIMSWRSWHFIHRVVRR